MQKDLIYFLLMLAHINSAGQVGMSEKIDPMYLVHDESFLDASFWNFKIKLANAVIEQKWDMLYPLLADTIYESNDGCKRCTQDEFVEYIKNNNEARFWEQMQKSLRYGFCRNDSNPPFNGMNGYFFQAPSFIDAIDLNCPDSILVLGENVNLRKAPGINSEIIETVSYKKLRVISTKNFRLESQKVNGITWLMVYTESGAKVYISSQYTSENIARTITVAKIDDEWKLIGVFMKVSC